ncbi:MAG: hypothetical protein MHM6MM_003588 [Cercozoa sp. M6MM]
MEFACRLALCWLLCEAPELREFVLKRAALVDKFRCAVPFVDLLNDLARCNVTVGEQHIASVLKANMLAVKEVTELCTLAKVFASKSDQLELELDEEDNAEDDLGKALLQETRFTVLEASFDELTALCEQCTCYFGSHADDSWHNSALTDAIRGGNSLFFTRFADVLRCHELAQEVAPQVLQLCQLAEQTSRDVSTLAALQVLRAEACVALRDLTGAERSLRRKLEYGEDACGDVLRLARLFFRFGCYRLALLHASEAQSLAQRSGDDNGTRRTLLLLAELAAETKFHDEERRILLRAVRTHAKQDEELWRLTEQHLRRSAERCECDATKEALLARADKVKARLLSCRRETPDWASDTAHALVCRWIRQVHARTQAERAQQLCDTWHRADLD